VVVGQAALGSPASLSFTPWLGQLVQQLTVQAPSLTRVAVNKIQLVLF